MTGVAAAVWCVACGGPPEVAISIERNGVLAHYGACLEHVEAVARRVRAEHQRPLEPAVRVATMDDGSQVLLELHADGTALAATRHDRRETWGPPAELVE